MSIDGYFDINIKTPLGEKFATLHLISAGNDLTGEFITTKATFPINGSIDGNQITFTTQISISMGEINAQISGEVTEEGFTGEAKVLFGKLPIQGTRKPQI